MIIRIQVSGGFAGIAAALKPERRVEVADGSDMARAFDPNALARIADAPCRDCPDGITYRITVTASGGSHAFSLTEAQLPPALLDLIDRI